MLLCYYINVIPPSYIYTTCKDLLTDFQCGLIDDCFHYIEQFIVFIVFCFNSYRSKLWVL